MKKLFGVLHVVKTTDELVVDVLREGGYQICREHFDDELPEQDKEVAGKIYILADGKMFRVAEQEAVAVFTKQDGIPDGLPVYFEALEVQKGRYRWAKKLARAQGGA